jgi:hypothetical protein|tara:strand:+ start:164 stop:328 length:165 start_codon:yes stop_codon:yes gene_type:complete
MEGTLIIIKWLALLFSSLMGMMLAIGSEYTTTGLVLFFGCFLIFAVDVARNFID